MGKMVADTRAAIDAGTALSMVDPQRVSIVGYALGGKVGLLTAADDGPGVDEDSLPRLFERFYRADAARTTRGTGLGLAIVKHVVVAAGGDVEADGREGGGLQIRCSFPLG